MAPPKQDPTQEPDPILYTLGTGAVVVLNDEPYRVTGNRTPAASGGDRMNYECVAVLDKPTPYPILWISSHDRVKRYVPPKVVEEPSSLLGMPSAASRKSANLLDPSKVPTVPQPPATAPAPKVDDLSSTKKPDDVPPTNNP